jgi:hypothetical protein
MNSASTSKKRRNAGRVSLRPKPSVPSGYSPPGTHRWIISGTDFMKSLTATKMPSSFASVRSR